MSGHSTNATGIRQPRTTCCMVELSMTEPVSLPGFTEEEAWLDTQLVRDITCKRVDKPSCKVNGHLVQ